MQELIFHSTTREELKQLLEEAVKVQLEKHLSKEEEEDSRLLTRKEVAEILSISLPTLNTYTKKGIIQATRLGSMVRYRRFDVDNALKNMKYIKHARN